MGASPQVFETAPGTSPVDELLETPFGDPHPPDFDVSPLGILFTVVLGLLVGLQITGAGQLRWVRWVSGFLLFLLGAGVLWLSTTVAHA